MPGHRIAVLARHPLPYLPFTGPRRCVVCPGLPPRARTGRYRTHPLGRASSLRSSTEPDCQSNTQRAPGITSKTLIAATDNIKHAGRCTVPYVTTRRPYMHHASKYSDLSPRCTEVSDILWCQVEQKMSPPPGNRGSLLLSKRSRRTNCTSLGRSRAAALLSHARSKAHTIQCATIATPGESAANLLPICCPSAAHLLPIRTAAHHSVHVLRRP
jgi:hypothetical protein